MAQVIQLHKGSEQQTPIKREGNVSQNRERGFIALYRSLVHAPWADEMAKVSCWLHLLMQARYNGGTAHYRGKEWTLKRGQLVITVGDLREKLKDTQGRPLNRNQVVRLLGFFEDQGMITTSGTKFGTVITISRYDDYQSLVLGCSGEHQPEQPPEHQPEQRREQPTNSLQTISGKAGDGIEKQACEQRREQPSEQQPEHSTEQATEQPRSKTKINQGKEKRDLGPADAELSRDDFLNSACEVAEHLDSVVGSNTPRGPQSNTIRGIMNRLSEGFTAEDLKLVVDFKHAEWKDEPRMIQHLKPSTLFAPKNCQGYLMGAQLWSKQGKPPITKTPQTAAKPAPVQGMRSVSTTAITDSNNTTEVLAALRSGLPWDRVSPGWQAELKRAWREGQLSNHPDIEQKLIAQGVEK